MARQSDLDNWISKINSTPGISQDEKQRLRQLARSLANANGDMGPSDRDRMRSELNSVTSSGGSQTGGGQTGDGSGMRSCESVKGAAPPGYVWSGYVLNGVDSCQLVWVGEDKDQDGSLDPFDPDDDNDGAPDTEDPNPGTPDPPAPDPTEPAAPVTPTDDTAQRQAASAYLSDLLRQYGLDELIPTVDALIREWGTNTSVIVSRLRGTEAYKARFRGNEFRVKNGYNAMSEAEYLSTEDAIKTTMRQYGLTADYFSRDKLATLIGGDVSATEVDSRIGAAKKIIDSADPNIKSSLVRLYGASTADMLGYVLAPETALSVIQRRVNAGIATGVAAGAGIDLGSYGDVSLSEQIGDLTYGDERTLRSQFDSIGDIARSTRRLTKIDRENVSDRDVVRGEFGIDQNAGQTVKRLQSRERARFSGQSATTSSTLSGGGI